MLCFEAILLFAPNFLNEFVGVLGFETNIFLIEDPFVDVWFVFTRIQNHATHCLNSPSTWQLAVKTIRQKNESEKLKICMSQLSHKVNQS